MSIHHPRTESEERERLDRIRALLGSERDRIVDAIESAAGDLEDHKEFLWEHRRDMDGSEKSAFRSIVDVSISVGEYAVATRARLERLLSSPYFGRVDFRSTEQPDAGAHYIGVHSVHDPDSQAVLIHDWRAPVSSLYYDYEAGEASFVAPEGRRDGEIVGKRQYKIIDGELEYMLDSALTIGDDVLQRELSRSADDKMKNIVSTIQREQNAIIRNESADTLILQGVAGSGKTSIALHRVAFLLYRFKETLSSSNILILSPNKIFGDYISNVLPELGEERIAEIDVDALAARFLPKSTRFQSSSEQVAMLLDGRDDAARERMRFKSTPAFVEELDAFIDAQSASAFDPQPFEHRGERLTPEWLRTVHDSLPTTPLFTRVDRVADSAIHRIKQELAVRNGRWAASDSTAVRRAVRGMLRIADPVALYRAFYDDPARQGLLARGAKGRWEYADVFPLVYTHLRTMRADAFDEIRHLVVDEMQDYTAVQYAVLKRLFSCPMTILGDAAQSVNPYSSSNIAVIQSIFPSADTVELRRSYRSTTEITEFAQSISRNPDLLPVERHGPAPRILPVEDDAAQVALLAELMREHRESEHQSLAIVCRTVGRAERLRDLLAERGEELTLLDYDSRTFAEGAVITSAHIAKGLEFDVVLVPDADRATFASDLDRGLLYIACTRAMHELVLTHTGPVSPLLEFAVSAGAAGAAGAAGRA